MTQNISKETVNENKAALQKLYELIEFANKLLHENPQRINELTRKQLILFLTFGPVNNYTEAIHVLCRNAYPDASIVLLRSLLEAFINTRYILDTNSDRRLALFHLEDAHFRIKFSKEMFDFKKRYPNFESKSDLTNEDFLKQQLNIAENQISDIKKQYKIKSNERLPSLLDRAKANDKKSKRGRGNMEYNYQTVYRFFSQYSHLTSRGINIFLEPKPEGGYDLMTSKSLDIGPAVATTYAIYLFFLENLMKWHVIKKVALTKYRKVARNFSKRIR